nr:formin-like protein 6 [Leptinotarsa decemlineata]
MPAPPPPPPMAPGAPPIPNFKLSKSSANERNALLNSIKKGTKLKKTVTNDKSAPFIPEHTAHLLMGGLAVGLDFGIFFMKCLAETVMTSPLTKTPCMGSSVESNNAFVVQPVTTAETYCGSKQRYLITPETNVQRQPFFNKEITSNGSGLHKNKSSPNTNSNLTANPSTLHRKAKSNVNLSTLEVSDDKKNGFQPFKPVINHGKPNLAPKPPVLSIKPTGLQIKHNKPISRTHSLKSPRTPPPQSPDDNPMNKFGTVRHMSSIIGQSLANSAGHNSRSRPALNGRPPAPPPSVPTQHTPNHISSPSQPPPPPPPKVNTVKHPNQAPPPPPPISTIPQAPSHAPPPPPPHKTQQSRPPLSVPQENNNINPPPPPPRHSSMREASMNVRVNLEEKFKTMFKPPNTFPQPPPFKNVIKLYNYKPGLKSGFN